MLSPKARSPSPLGAELKQIQAANTRLMEENAQLKAEITSLREELHALRNEIRQQAQPQLTPEKRRKTERSPPTPVEPPPAPLTPAPNLAEISQQLATILNYMQQTNIRFEKLEAHIQTHPARLARRDMKPYSRPTPPQEDHPTEDGSAQE